METSRQNNQERKKLALQEENNLYNNAGGRNIHALLFSPGYYYDVPPLKFAYEKGWLPKSAALLMISMMIEFLLIMLLSQIWQKESNTISIFGFFIAEATLASAMYMTYRKSTFAFIVLLSIFMSPIIAFIIGRAI